MELLFVIVIGGREMFAAVSRRPKRQARSVKATDPQPKQTENLWLEKPVSLKQPVSSAQHAGRNEYSKSSSKSTIGNSISKLAQVSYGITRHVSKAKRVKTSINKIELMRCQTSFLLSAS